MIRLARVLLDAFDRAGSGSAHYLGRTNAPETASTSGTTPRGNQELRTAGLQSLRSILYAGGTHCALGFAADGRTGPSSRLPRRTVVQ